MLINHDGTYKIPDKKKEAALATGFVATHAFKMRKAKIVSSMKKRGLLPHGKRKGKVFRV